MSTSVVKHDTQPEPPASRGMQWFFLIVLTMLTILALIVPIIVMYISRNPNSYYLYAVLVPIIQLWKYLAHSFFPVERRAIGFKTKRIELQIAPTKTDQDKGHDDED